MVNLFNHAYPYLSEHELNLDWLIAKMKELNIKFDEFKVVNNITFSGAWDITKQYPAWTIVSDNNIGYVSIQPVPVGVVLTNTDYWVEVIDYTAQIAGLQQRVVDLEAEDVVINGKIDTLTDRVDLLTNKRYILVSDSYGVVTDPWTTAFKTRLGLADDDCYITAVGGYGFKPSYVAYFIDLLTALEGNVTNPDTITDIIVVGGFNDRITTTSDLKTAISQFCTYAKAHYINANIWIGGAGWSFNYEFVDELKNGQYLTAYKACERYGAVYLKGMDYIMHDKDLFLEEPESPYTLHLGHQYVHPNTEASEMIVDCIISNLKGSSYTVLSKTVADLTLATGITVNGDKTFRMLQNDDEITIDIKRCYFYLPATESDNPGTRYIELGTLTEGKVAGSQSANCFAGKCPVIGFLVDNGVNRGEPIELLFANNRLYANMVSDGAFSIIAIAEGTYKIPIYMA